MAELTGIGAVLTAIGPTNPGASRADGQLESGQSDRLGLVGKGRAAAQAGW